jgi:hypothetical protein
VRRENALINIDQWNWLRIWVYLAFVNEKWTKHALCYGFYILSCFHICVRAYCLFSETSR